MQAADPFEKGLPANLEAERFVLGSILLNEKVFLEVAGEVEADDFSLEKNRRIFNRMGELQERGERIDRITVANELMRFNELESCDGISYLVSLDDGLPQIVNLGSYVQIVKEKATLRRIAYAAERILKRALAAVDDSTEILADAQQSLLGIGAEEKSSLLNASGILDRFEGGVEAFLSPSKRAPGITTGYRKLDRITGGLRPGELIVIAARPAMGKSTLALNIGEHVAVAMSKPVAVFSLEMGSDQLLERLVCGIGHVDHQSFRRGELSADERTRFAAALYKATESPLYIDDTAGVRMMDIRAKALRMKMEHGLALVIVDYLQLMAPGKGESREQQVANISRGMKVLAKELGVPVLLLAQLNRAVESRGGDHRPQLSDLRESGAIEQDADMVVFVFREEVYKPDHAELKGLAELILAKQRQGPSGMAEVAFLGQFYRFENLAEGTE